MKAKLKSNACEAAKLLTLLVKVNRIRDEIRELAEDPDLDSALHATPFDEYTRHDIGCIDLPLHKIADGAALAYSRLVGEAGQ